LIAVRRSELQGDIPPVRIAQVAPLDESVPPALYGGTERVVSYLTEELVRLGHQVTLFASGDSRTAARLVAPCEQALRLNPACREPLVHHLIMFDQLRREVDTFDIVHFHTCYLHYAAFADLGAKSLTTQHGRLDMPDMPVLLRAFPQMQLVSISDSQRAPVPWASWRATVYHGQPLDLHRPGPGRGGYLLFVGRVSPEKGVDRAIEIAKRAGMPLKITAKVDRVDRDYFRDAIKPLLDHPLIEFIGELNSPEKDALLRDAVALLFPIDWPEPFGLVMIEAMACGTPVVAFRNGSVPEVVDDGVTGAIVDDIDGAVRAVARVAGFDRARVRARFEQRFSADRMARDYVRIYEAMIGETSLVPKAPLLLEAQYAA
jgi:glycosyltransferase involved in cell wall biosynthesis